MIIIRALLLLLHFTLVPVAVGRLITYRVNNPLHRNPIVTYMTGLFGSWGIFYVLFAIFEWRQNWNTKSVLFLGSFSLLTKAYTAVIIALVILWLILDRKNLKLQKPKLTLTKYTAIYGIVFAIIFDRTGKLWTAILAHMAANTFAFFGPGLPIFKMIEANPVYNHVLGIGALLFGFLLLFYWKKS